MNTARTLRSATLAIALLTLSLAASAGGPLEAPDGVANPGGDDFTGFDVYGWVLGVEHITIPVDAVQTAFHCANFGPVPVGEVFVQFYDDAADFGRPPVGTLRIGGALPPGDVDNVDTSDADLAGEIPRPGRGVARIIFRRRVPRPFPALECSVYIQDIATGETITELSTIRAAIPKLKKKRKRRR